MFKTKTADWFFIIPAILVWLTALMVTAWDFWGFKKAVYHFGWASLIGLFFMVTGVGIRVIARKSLGRQFSYALRTLQEHELVTHGIYEHVRHPAYSGDLLFHFGTPLLFSSVYGFLVMLLLIPCILYRIRIEESMLVERFGDGYRKYKQATKKLVPYLY